MYLREITVQQPGEVLLVLAQIGSLGVGGFQLDVSLEKKRDAAHAEIMSVEEQFPRSSDRCVRLQVEIV